MLLTFPNYCGRAIGLAAWSVCLERNDVCLVWAKRRCVAVIDAVSGETLHRSPVLPLPAAPFRVVFIRRITDLPMLALIPAATANAAPIWKTNDR
jgi:hypothetical protein